MAHRVVGLLKEGQQVKVYESHKSFVNYFVSEVSYTCSNHIIGFTLMKGDVERCYTVRERLNEYEVRATLENI